jgi:hypothetical protein
MTQFFASAMVMSAVTVILTLKTMLTIFYFPPQHVTVTVTTYHVIRCKDML